MPTIDPMLEVGPGDALGFEFTEFFGEVYPVVANYLSDAGVVSYSSRGLVDCYISANATKRRPRWMPESVPPFVAFRRLDCGGCVFAVEDSAGNYYCVSVASADTVTTTLPVHSDGASALVFAAACDDAAIDCGVDRLLEADGGDGELELTYRDKYGTRWPRHPMLFYPKGSAYTLILGGRPEQEVAIRFMNINGYGAIINFDTQYIAIGMTAGVLLIDISRDNEHDHQ